MQETMVTEREPLIAPEDFPAKTETNQVSYTIENKKLIAASDELAAHKQKLLMKKILFVVVVVNLIVLISIILSA
jgi:hypothetical protein